MAGIPAAGEGRGAWCLVTYCARIDISSRMTSGVRRIPATGAGALGILLAALLTAAPSRAQPVEDRLACEAAIAAQEPGSGLPPGLLRAIAHVESGKWDAQLQRSAPWPWAFNAEGTSHLATGKEDAVHRVRRLLAQGVRSVDVGCMQINLRHHPQAFATLEEGFDPQRNVAYAIRLLHELHRRHGDWPAAIMRYHSGTVQRGEAYARRVNLAWAGAMPPRAAPSFAPPAAPMRDRVAVLLSQEAMLVQVIRPSAVPAGNRPVMLAMPRER
jgi:hypothetical protein